MCGSGLQPVCRGGGDCALKSDFQVPFETGRARSHRSVSGCADAIGGR